MNQFTLRAPAQTSSFNTTVTSVLMGAVVVLAGVLTFAVPYFA